MTRPGSMSSRLIPLKNTITSMTVGLESSNATWRHYMADMQQFRHYLSLADQLASFATKEDLAECARLLAINVAHYESVYGELPLDETLAMALSLIHISEPTRRTPISY